MSEHIPNIADPIDASAAELQLSGAKIRKLLNRLSWGVPAGVMFLVLLLTFAAYQFRAKPLALESAQAMQREAAERVAAKVDGLAGQVDRIVLTVKDWVQAGVVNLDDPAGMNRVLIPVIQQRSIVSSIHVASDDGREVLLLKSPDGWKNRVTDVPRKGAQQRWLAWKDAQTPLGEEWKKQDYDPRKRPWYTGVMSAPENRVFWTAPYIFQSTQEPGITAALRWTDKASGRQWVVAFDVLLSDLTRLTLDMGYAKHGNVALLAPDGKVLGLPRGAGFENDEAIKKAVMQEPGTIGLTALTSALKQSSVDDAVVLGTPVQGPGGVWLVKLLRQPLRNQEFVLALMAPQSDFSIWSLPLILVVTLSLLFLCVGSVMVARRLHHSVAEPVSVLFEQLGAGNRELASRGSRAVALSALSTELQKAQTFAGLGDALLCGLAQHVALGQGSLYLAEEAQQRLVLCSGFARLEGASPLPVLAFGEGMVGQCGLDKQPLRLNHPPAGYLRVTTALGEASPQMILIQPVMKADILLGVIELALLSSLTENDQVLLDSVLPTLALCIEILERNERTRKLLLATQEQASTLEQQSGEIAQLLKEQESIFQNAPHGIIYTGDGVMLRANQRVAEYFGTTVDQLVGQSSQSIYSSIEDFGASLNPL